MREIGTDIYNLVYCCEIQNLPYKLTQFARYVCERMSKYF